MKQFSIIMTIFFSEISRFLKNRNQMISAFIVTPFVVYLIFYALTLSGAGYIQGVIRIYGAEAHKEVLSVNFSEPFYCFEEKDLEADPFLNNRDENDVVVDVTPDTIRVIYDSSKLTNPSTLDSAKQVAESILALQINEGEYPAYLNTVSTIHTFDISSATDYISNVLIPLVSLAFVVALMLTNMVVSGLTIDMITGQRERGSFDILQLTGVKISSIIFGKYCAAALVNTLMLVVSGAFLLFGIQNFQPELYQIAMEQVASNSRWFLPICGCFLSIAVVSSALFIVIACFFDKQKQAASYSVFIELTLSLFSYVPGLLGEEFLNYMPIGNLSVVTEATFVGNTTIYYVAGCLGNAFLVAVLSLCFAAKILERKVTL